MAFILPSKEHLNKGRSGSLIPFVCVCMIRRETKRECAFSPDCTEILAVSWIFVSKQLIWR